MKSTHLAIWPLAVQAHCTLGLFPVYPFIMIYNVIVTLHLVMY